MTNKQLVLFDDNWVSNAPSQAANDSWVHDVLRDIRCPGGIYLNTLRIWFQRFPLQLQSKKHLKQMLESFDNANHLGAVNELSWWELMPHFGWSAKPLPTSSSKRPDFHVLRPADFFCEVTTLNVSEKDRKALENGKGVRLSYGPTIDRILRKIIDEKMEQIKYGASKQKASVLVLFDYTEWSGFVWQFYRELASYLLGEKLGFLSLPLELSALLYVEKKVIDGRIAISKQRLAVYHHPKKTYPISQTVFQMMRQYFLRMDEVELIEFITTKGDWFLL